MNNPAPNDVAQRAYDLWERDGRPPGRDQEYWFHAERELIGATTAEEDRPIGEIRQAEQSSAPQVETTVSRPPDPPSQAAPTTAAEDCPIGEIRQAQRASAERAVASEPNPVIKAAQKAKAGSEDLTAQLTKLQRLMDKGAPAPETATRAKKAGGGEGFSPEPEQEVKVARAGKAPSIPTPTCSVRLYPPSCACPRRAQWSFCL